MRGRMLVVCSVLAAAGASFAQPPAAAHPDTTTPAAAGGGAETPSKPPSTPEASGEVDPLRSRVNEWTVRVNPQVWWTSPSGKVRLPSASGSTAGSDSVRVERLNLDTPRFSPMGTAEIAGGDWRFTLTGAAYSLSRDQTTADDSFQLGDIAVTPGDTLRTNFEFATFELTGGYRVWRRDFKEQSEHPEDAVDFVLSTLIVGGLRIYETDFSVRDLSLSAGNVAQSDQLFFEPIVGVRFEAEIARDFGINLLATTGAMADSDRSSASLDLAVSFTWNPTPSVGAQIGWRQIAYWLSDGEGAREFEYNGRMAGLFAGVTVQF